MRVAVLSVTTGLYKFVPVSEVDSPHAPFWEDLNARETHRSTPLVGEAQNIPVPELVSAARQK